MSTKHFFRPKSILIPYPMTTNDRFFTISSQRSTPRGNLSMPEELCVTAQKLLRNSPKNRYSPQKTHGKAYNVPGFNIETIFKRATAKLRTIYRPFQINNPVTKDKKIRKFGKDRLEVINCVRRLKKQANESIAKVPEKKIQEAELYIGNKGSKSNAQKSKKLNFHLLSLKRKELIDRAILDDRCNSASRQEDIMLFPHVYNAISRRLSVPLPELKLIESSSTTPQTKVDMGVETKEDLHYLKPITKGTIVIKLRKGIKIKNS